MGYARIVSGGPTGRYTIEVDYGQNVKDAVLGALSILLSNINTEIGLAQMQVNEADALEAEAIQALEDLQEGYIAEALANPGSEISTLQLRGQAFILQQLRASNTPIRVKLKLLQHERKTTLDRIAYWNGFEPLQTKDVWCTTLTEDAEVGWFVATIDIPGETNLQLLAPECRGWTQTDGVMTARELMSPEQAFFNASILPGWQKFKPTYRWGTITALDYEADTANVSLFAAVSSAQRLGVNKASSLSNVPVEYMTCNARAFEVGDTCVVQFQGQDWGTPKVIGFLDNPKPCVEWPDISIPASGNFVYGTPSAREWILQRYMTPCGEAGIWDDDLKTAATANVSYAFSGAQFVTEPEEAGYTINVDYGAPRDFGYFNFQRQFADEEVPYGSSPGRQFAISITGSIVRMFVRTYPFSDVTAYEYNEGCGVAQTWTAPYFTLQPIGQPLGIGSEGPDEEIQTGTIVDILGTPTVSVTFNGTTRAYRLKSCSGLTAVFEVDD